MDAYSWALHIFPLLCHGCVITYIHVWLFVILEVWDKID